MKKVYTAMSTRVIEKAVEDLYLGLNEDGAVDNCSIKLIIFFASSMYDSSKVNSLMNDRFKNIELIGCTTAGELYSGHLGSNGIVAMGLTSGIIEDMHIEVIKDLDKGLPDFKPIINNFSLHFGESSSEVDNNKYFGILLVDGLSKLEEAFLEAFGDYTNIRFTGGSIGDDLKFISTTLFSGGKNYKNAGLICIIKASGTFGVERTQSFRTTGHILRVTKADESNRMIYELNGKPANIEYCSALGIDPSSVANHLIVNPLGLILDKQPFVRSVAKVLEDNSFSMYCGVKEGTELEILQSVNMLQETKVFLEMLRNKYTEINGLLAFNCILRYMEIKLMKKEEDFGALFKDIPTVGFCTYGEFDIGFVNQTLTALVF